MYIVIMILVVYWLVLGVGEIGRNGKGEKGRGIGEADRYEGFKERFSHASSLSSKIGFYFEIEYHL